MPAVSSHSPAPCLLLPPPPPLLLVVLLVKLVLLEVLHARVDGWLGGWMGGWVGLGPLLKATQRRHRPLVNRLDVKNWPLGQSIIRLLA